VPSGTNQNSPVVKLGSTPYSPIEIEPNSHVQAWAVFHQMEPANKISLQKFYVLAGSFHLHAWSNTGNPSAKGLEHRRKILIVSFCHLHVIPSLEFSRTARYIFLGTGQQPFACS
jgi:hypothetical protein